MSEQYVARTCTRLVATESGRREEAETSPLSAFRSERAYVLLGDAGAGKSTEFREEREALGDAAELIGARRFVAGNVSPTWQNKTLFIDGLDEIRVGLADGRSALDQIRSRLDQLGWPDFRLSCREADWLGSNDRRSLESDLPDTTITVLRLDPLSNSARQALAAALLEADDVSEFFREAERRDLGGMLSNPLTLGLLTGAFAHGEGSWPASRQSTFELASERMAREHNDEHIAAVKVSPPVEAVLTAAGEMCAIQLLAGIEGFSLGPAGDGSPYVALDMLQPPLTDIDNRESHLRRYALGTKLFSSPRASEAADSWPTMVPLHRHIAEFLGGRYLAGLVGDGLPARRVVALMVSPHDGRVVTSLRGLSAWLATHSAEALDRLIDADPVGIGLYGDISSLKVDQKRRLLQALADYAAAGPLLGHQWRDDPGAGYRETTAWAFRSIIDAETVEAVAGLLRGPAGGPASDRVADFTLRVLAEAEGAHLEAAKPLAGGALAIAREPTWSEWTRRSALQAFVHLEASEARDDALAALLADIAERRLSDPEDDLAGLVLRELYPRCVTPAEVWPYLKIRNCEHYSGTFESFWSRDIVDQSSAQDAAAVLDALWDEMQHQDLRGGIDEVLRQRAQDMMPVELLIKALDGCGDEVANGRLFGWLAAAASCGRDIHPAARQGMYDAIAGAEEELGPQAMEQLVDAGAEGESAVEDFIDPARRVREWLEQRPLEQRQLYLEWLKARRNDLGPLGHVAWLSPLPLFFSTLPRDLGSWCLQQALELEAHDPELARDVLGHVVGQQLHDPAVNVGLTLDVVSDATKCSPLLSAELERLLAPRPLDPKRSAHAAEIGRIERENERKEREFRRQWADHVRNNLQALADGSFPENDLHNLARIYFGHRYGSDQDVSGEERLTEFLQGESKLAAAVIEAFAAAVYRAELPNVDQTVALHAESKHAWGAWPLFAGLGLVERDEPERLQYLDDERKRRVLAMYFCVPHLLDRASPWLEGWLAAEPELVADVLVRCATGEVREGSDSCSALNELAELGLDDQTKHRIRLQVLKSFPASAPQRQLQMLDSLLFDVVAGCQSDGVQDLIDAKLAAKSLTVAQRTRWLAVAAILFEGPYADRFAKFTASRPAAAHRLAEFLHHRLGPPWAGGHSFADRLGPTTLATLVETLGSTYPPMEPISGGYSVTAGIRAAEWVESFLAALTRSASAEASDALRRLEQMPEMLAWRDVLLRSREVQSVVRSDAEYRSPTVVQVQRTLSRGTPVNAADLAAFLLDRLDDVADEMRGGADDPWRPYWNEDEYGRPDVPKPENSCRDSLLSTLSGRLPPEVDVVREGSYAANKRADIRVSCASFNVPIEIKRESHRDLWGAVHSQLIAQYTIDPATDGYGIYLVLWFGGEKMPTPASGQRPGSPDELQAMLEASLSLDESRKVSVRVIDVTMPGGAGPSSDQPRSRHPEATS